MSTPIILKTAELPPLTGSNTSVPRSRRINPWRMFIGSMVPNWLQCRPEISQGAKLAYARLAQYAGKDGYCFPKQETLAGELGIGERTANEYIRILVKFGLIEKERPGLGMSNRYFFLDHPWIYEGQPETSLRQESSAPERGKSSGQARQKISAPNSKENQLERESKENQHTRTGRWWNSFVFGRSS